MFTENTDYSQVMQNIDSDIKMFIYFIDKEFIDCQKFNLLYLDNYVDLANQKHINE